jgi:hypothetical protein
MFEYPIACPQHRDIEGHILFHVFEDYDDTTFPVDMTLFTKIPIGERSIYIPLAMIIIPENRYGSLSATLRGNAHEKCLAMVLEILRDLRASQYRMLAFLSDLPAHLIARDENGMGLCSEELAGISIGVINTLDLPSDPRVAPLIPGVVFGILAVKERMYHRQYRPEWENLAAEKEATITVNRLMSYLASMMIGGRNSQILACARNRETHSPAVGWLPMHTD